MVQVLASSLASQLPQGFVVGSGFVARHMTCGSWLASDGGGSANINIECADLIAGKPAPTGFRGASEICAYSVIFSKLR
ncbi:hypothetical protein EJA71_08320 [Pseudomonas sp. PB106]|nr:hypothetical protein EJA71_08320 [Pseudomonas sp. PB106]